MPSKKKLTAYNITCVAMMVATMVAGKWVLNSLPNIEVVSLFTVLYTTFFGWYTIFAVIVFIIIEGIVYGLGWWFYGYVLAWPVLFGVTFLFRKSPSNIKMALISGIFGLSFGALCEIPYSFMFGAKAGFAWWVAGIPYDVVHGVGNFLICLLLFNPLLRALRATSHLKP